MFVFHFESSALLSMPGSDISFLQRQKIRKYKVDYPLSSQTEIAKWASEKFGRVINQSSVCRILKEKCENVENIRNSLKKSGRNRTPNWPLLEALLNNWVKALQNTGATISEDTLKKRAMMVWNQIKNNYSSEAPPSLSPGWLSNVKKRLSISQRAVSGESGSVPKEALKLMPAVREQCREYSKKDIFNMDESALFYKLGPSKTLGSKPVPGPKKSKQRLTMVLCCNADGLERSDILLIGKAKAKDYVPSYLSIPYFQGYKCWWRTNMNAWMTGELMAEWLERFYEYIGTERKVILLLDNFAGHTKGLELSKPPSNIKVVFLPPNTTSLFQPLDQGIIRVAKAYYRRAFVEFCLPFWEREAGLIPTFDDGLADTEKDPFVYLNYSHAIKWISEAWFNHTTLLTVSNCFEKSTLFDVPNSTSVNSVNSQNLPPEATNAENAADTSFDLSRSEENLSINSTFDSDATLYCPESDSESDDYNYFNAGRSVLRDIDNENVIGSYDPENDDIGTFTDAYPREGDPDLEVLKITTEVRNLTNERHINKSFALDYFSGPAEELSEAKDIENRANLETADQDLLQEAQKYATASNIETIGEDEKMVREYFSDMSSSVRTILDTLSFDKSFRENSLSIFDVMKKGLRNITQMIEEVEDGANENSMCVNEILKESSELFFSFCEGMSFNASRKRYPEQMKRNLSEVKRLMRVVNEELSEDD